MAGRDSNGDGDSAGLEEQPYRWSQRWCDDPPVGTVNLDGGRNPEIHVGNGEWKPLGHGEAHAI